VICASPLYRRPKQIKNGAVYCKKHWKSSCVESAAKQGAILLRAQYIECWKAGLESGMRGSTAISRHIRSYLFDKYKSKCCKCGWSEVHKITGKVPLEVNHVDGNHKNNKESNLELICPNCHSLTDSYRSLNYGNGRGRT